MISEKGLQLLTLAQSGDKIAEEQLIILIRDEHMRRRIGRYLHKNRQVDDDDLKQEFLIGVGLAIPKANLTIGDPVEYVINQGVYNVRSYLRKHIIQSTSQICGECGHITRLNRVNNVYVCKKCGSTHIETRETNDTDEVVLTNIVDKFEVESDVLSRIMIEEFEKTLTPNTNVYNLYILLKKGVNRDNPQVKNYIKEIAKMWGGCSDQNVIQAMDKLKLRLVRFANENDMEIKDGAFIVREDKL